MRKRAQRYPLQYIIGTVSFCDAEIRVTPDVLIPRPETETLVQHVIHRVGVSNAPLRCLDMGTGSGCIAIALALAFPMAQCDATEISEEAVMCARNNARRNGVDDRVHLYQGSWWDAVPRGAQYDVIVANPPYVAKGTRLTPEVMHEPATALFADDNGCGEFFTLFSSLPQYLSAQGFFMGEISPEQAARLSAYARKQGMTAECSKDETGRYRYIYSTLNTQ